MWFHIDPSGGTPIYLQIVDQVKQAVAGGVLLPGQRLPATRELATTLAVNPNTVVKAYQVLEREGLIDLPRGRGAFVAAQPEVDRGQSKIEALRPMVVRLVAEAYRLGCADHEVVDLVRVELDQARTRRVEAVEEQEVGSEERDSE